MNVTEATGDSERGGESSWMRPATVIVTLGILLFGGWTVARQWAEIAAASAEIGLSRVLWAIVLSGFGIIATGECWRRWLDALSPGTPISTAHRLFYATQVGKYLPGGLWPIVSQVSLASRFGIPRPAILGATALFLTTHLVTGAMIGGLVFAHSDSRWSMMLIVTLAGIVALSPPLLRRAARVVARFSSTDEEVPLLRLPQTLAASSTMLIAWAAYGGATLIIMRPFDRGASGALTVIGAVALSWVTGFLAFLAPAGIGAREATFVALLAPLVGTSSALTVALLSRAATTIGDVALGVLSAGVVSTASRSVEVNDQGRRKTH